MLIFPSFSPSSAISEVASQVVSSCDWSIRNSAGRWTAETSSLSCRRSVLRIFSMNYSELARMMGLIGILWGESGGSCRHVCKHCCHPVRLLQCERLHQSSSLRGEQRKALQAPPAPPPTNNSVRNLFKLGLSTTRSFTMLTTGSAGREGAS